MLERNVQRFHERKELERQVGFLLSFFSLKSFTLATLDCVVGAYSPFYGIYGSQTVLYGCESKTARSPQVRPDTAAKESTHA